MWLIVGSAEHGVELEWWPTKSEVGVQPVDTRATIALAADPPIGHEQWTLIRKQFENMGIRARDVRDKT